MWRAQHHTRQVQARKNITYIILIGLIIESTKRCFISFFLSFSDGGEFETVPLAVRHALDMVQGGADIIDIGGESTRPGSAVVSLEEEVRRVIPVIR